MKNVFRTLTAFVLCFTFVCTFFVRASASDNEVIDYAALFEQSQSISHESLQSYVTSLKNAFAGNPTAFLDALSAENEDTLTRVVFHLISGNTLDEIYELRDSVKEYGSYSGIVSALDQEIGVREYALSMEPYMQYEDPDAPFSVAILKRFIDLNIANETFDKDEDFNHMLATTYEASPEHFAQALSTYTQAEIESIAKCVSADYAKLGKAVPAVTQNVVSQENQAIINLIQNEIAEAVNPQLQTEEMTIAPPTVDIMSSCIPTIGNITFTTAPLLVGQTEVLNVVFSESTQITYLRQWYVEVFQVVDSTYIRKSAMNIAISPGATSAAINFPITFTSTGTIKISIKVYSMEGGSQLATKLSDNSYTVSALWYITINFLADRNQYGTLRLYNTYGTLLLTADCLGKSAENRPWNEENGDTPTGTYTGRLSGPDAPASSYGPYQLVAMQGVSGNIVSTGRWGIGIHGGEDVPVLMPTNGCIRVFNNVQLTIATTIENLMAAGYSDTGYVYVSETSG